MINITEQTTENNATALLSEVILKADKRKLVRLLLDDDTFRKTLLSELSTESQIVTDLPATIDSYIARNLLGGISDSILSRVRKQYPEMLDGGPRSRHYNRDIVLRIAKLRRK